MGEVLQISKRAAASATKRGDAVAGADGAAAAKSRRLRLALTPDFVAGRGGTVRFATSLRMNHRRFTVDICVRFSRTAFGIPAQVACRARSGR